MKQANLLKRIGMAFPETPLLSPNVQTPAAHAKARFEVCGQPTLSAAKAT